MTHPRYPTTSDYFITETVSLEEMLEWPHTPTREMLDQATHFYRVSNLDDALSADPNAPPASYAAQAVLWLDARERGSSIERNIAAIMHDPSMFPKVSTLMMHAAMDGNTDDQIGMTIMIAYPGEILIKIDQLSRDPQWMGFCEWLPAVNGLYVYVIQSHQQLDQPGAIIARNSPLIISETPTGETPTGETPTGDFPDGQGRDLAALLSWHGAFSTTWIETKFIRDMAQRKGPKT